MSTNTTHDMSASFISPADQSSHTLELTMQQTPYKSTNATVRESYIKPMTYDRINSYVRAMVADMEKKNEWWNSKISTHISQTGSDDSIPPPPSTDDKVNDDLSVAATNLYTALGRLRQYYGTDPRNYFPLIHEVREAKCKLRSMEGYPDLSAEIRGGIEDDEQNVFFGVYAASSSKETSRSITRNPSTEQGFKDYFEIEGPCTLPPVCDHGSHFVALADRHRNGLLASIAYLLCKSAECSQYHNMKRRWPI